MGRINDIKELIVSAIEDQGYSYIETLTWNNQATVPDSWINKAFSIVGFEKTDSLEDNMLGIGTFDVEFIVSMLADRQYSQIDAIIDNLKETGEPFNLSEIVSEVKGDCMYIMFKNLGGYPC